jgi:bifunctional DNA-binding transcriptional regulator/antitoxin component of YhaV-PrlF toxin-antitoxin module
MYTYFNIVVIFLVYGVVMATKQTRKIIKIGTSSFGVIIPIGWLRFYELKHGDMVEVISNGNLTISPCGAKEEVK